MPGANLKQVPAKNIVVKKVIVKGKEYLELPEDLSKKKLLIIKLEDELYLVGSDEKVRDTIKKQVKYLVSRKKREERPRGRIIKAPELSEKGGYWVFDTEQEAAIFSRRHAEEFQSGYILGIRGFDGKFYAVRRNVYDALLPKILSLLRESPRTVEELSTLLRKDKNLVKAVLELAREEGVVVERAGGVYEYAG